jgi:hypothetical protein
MEKARIRLLEEIQTNRAWEAVEEYRDEYFKSLGLNDTIKRDTEFNSIWDRAFAEGGRHHLIQFFNNMEDEVRNNL